MKRTDLEHIIRAAGDITGERELVIIGSQAILGQFPNAPEALLGSREADVYFPGRPELAQKVEGAIGELSRFDDTHGFYAGSADDRTPTLPQEWRTRLIPIVNANTNGITGWCLEVHDIAVAKYAAGRKKDHRYITVLWTKGMIQLKTMLTRLDTTPLDPVRKTQLLARVRSDANAYGGLDTPETTGNAMQEAAKELKQAAKELKPPRSGTSRKQGAKSNRERE